MQPSRRAHDALLTVLRLLADGGYRFVTPTPVTHARVVARPDRQVARTIRDVLGWSLPFAPGLLPAPLHGALGAAGALERRGANIVARIRVSTLDDTSFVHSAYPTEDAHSVFLGPDSYRFAAFIKAGLAQTRPAPRVIDLGAGAGVGGIVAGRHLDEPTVTLVDINPAALFLAGVNAAFAGLPVEAAQGDGLAAATGDADLILANPPFIIDPSERAYRHGGDMHGARLSLDWALAAAKRLSPGGRLLLYTGSAIVDGEDMLATALAEALPPLDCTFDHVEIDPDIFGEELAEPAYAAVERIAAVGITVTRRG